MMFLADLGREKEIRGGVEAGEFRGIFVHNFFNRRPLILSSK